MKSNFGPVNLEGLIFPIILKVQSVFRYLNNHSAVDKFNLFFSENIFLKRFQLVWYQKMNL